MSELFEDKKQTISKMKVIDALFSSDSLNTMREIISILKEEKIKVTNSQDVLDRIRRFEDEMYKKDEKNFFEDQNGILLKIDGVEEGLSLRFIPSGRNLKIKIKLDFHGLERSKPLNVSNKTLEEFIKEISILIKELIEEMADYKLRHSRESEWSKLEPENFGSSGLLQKAKKIAERYWLYAMFNMTRKNNFSFELQPVRDVFKEKFIISEQFNLLKKCIEELVKFYKKQRYYLSHLNPSSNRLYMNFEFFVKEPTGEFTFQDEEGNKETLEREKYYTKIIDNFIEKSNKDLKGDKHEIIIDTLKAKK
jgi:hypothetical protein